MYKEKEDIVSSFKMNEKVRKRGKKVTHRQKEKLISHLEDNVELYTGKSANELDSEDKRGLWLEVANKLNACSGGAVKNWSDWRKCWLDLKCRAKSKHQIINKMQCSKMIGGETSLEIRALDPLEERIIALITNTADDGIDRVAEAGFGDWPQTNGQRKRRPSLGDEESTDSKKQFVTTYEPLVIEVDVPNQDVFVPENDSDLANDQSPDVKQDPLKSCQLKDATILTSLSKSASSTPVSFIMENVSVLQNEKDEESDIKIKAEADRLQLERKRLQLEVRKVDLLRQLVRAEQRKATALEELVNVFQLHYNIKKEQL